MENLEKQMIELLANLKKEHAVVAVKAEFEAEGEKLEEVTLLKELATRAGLDLTLKIGGCEAVRDLYDSMAIDTKYLVAPMIESPYALKKFINASKRIFLSENLDELNLFINIETPMGVANLDEILDCEEASFIKGIVFGRNDMCKALNLPLEEIDSDTLLNYAKSISEKVKTKNKKFIVGGCVSVDSIKFFKALNPNLIDKFETRKIIFDANKALSSTDLNLGLVKALEFEIMWIKNKCNFKKQIPQADFKRLQALEERISKLTPAS